MRFEWNPEKARANRKKHGVSFADAATALEDELALTIRDPSAEAEERFVTIGQDLQEQVLVVVFTWRKDRIRLISARKATRHERKRYQED